MRSAICISGLGRTYRKTVDRFYSNLYEPLRRQGPVDVFVSIWSGHIGTRPAHQGDSPVVIEEIDRLYRPRVIEVETYDRVAEWFEWPRFTDRPCPVYTEGYVFLPMLMQYKVWRANELKRVAEILNHKRYDLVIRTRFDRELMTPLPVAIIDPTRIGVLGSGGDRIVDYFYLSGSEPMDRLCSAFFSYPELFSSESNLDPEHLLWKHAIKNSLSTYVLEGLSHAGVRDGIRHEWNWNPVTRICDGTNVNT